MFKVLRTSGLIKEIVLYLGTLWNMEFVSISFIKPDVHKTLNINISGYVNNIIIEFKTTKLLISVWFPN